MQASEYLGKKPADSGWRISKAVSVRVLADRQQEFADSRSDPSLVDSVRRHGDGQARRSRTRLVTPFGGVQWGVLEAHRPLRGRVHVPLYSQALSRGNFRAGTIALRSPGAAITLPDVVSNKSRLPNLAGFSCFPNWLQNRD